MVYTRLKEAQESVQSKSGKSSKTKALGRKESPTNKLNVLEQKYLKKKRVKTLSSEDDLSDDSLSFKLTFKEVTSALEIQSKQNTNLKSNKPEEFKKINDKTPINTSLSSESDEKEDNDINNIMTVEDILGYRSDNSISNDSQSKEQTDHNVILSNSENSSNSVSYKENIQSFEDNQHILDIDNIEKSEETLVSTSEEKSNWIWIQ